MRGTPGAPTFEHVGRFVAEDLRTPDGLGYGQSAHIASACSECGALVSERSALVHMDWHAGKVAPRGSAPYTGDMLATITACEETGHQAAAGACPVHGGDGCLVVYTHSRWLNVAGADDSHSHKDDGEV